MLEVLSNLVFRDSVIYVNAQAAKINCDLFLSEILDF